MTPERLTVVPVHQVTPPSPDQAWLVESLWCEQAVGLVGGAPKTCKTWLALELATAVASGRPALGRFRIPRRGPVLVYAAEDALPAVRTRVEALVLARGGTLAELDLGLISAPTLRLDAPRDCERLRATLKHHQPRLLVLDPLVRLHRGDENSAAEVSALLGELRALQREFAVAILLVHHLRKNGPAAQPGLALRGSGDLHAWGDSNLYLHRRGGHLVLAVEHRNAPAPQPLHLELAANPAPHLRSLEALAEDQDPGLEQRVLQALTAAKGPMDRESLRHTLRTRNHSLGLALVRLRTQGLVERGAGGFRLDPRTAKSPVPALAHERERNGPASPAAGAVTAASPPVEDRATVATDPSAPGGSRGMGGRGHAAAPPLLLTPFPREQTR